MKSSSRTQASPGRIGTVCTVNPRRSAMPANRKCRLGKQSAAMSSLRPCRSSIRQRPDDGVQRGGDIFRRRHRAGGRADESTPSREESLPDPERLRPLSVIRRSPECCRRVASAFGCARLSRETCRWSGTGSSRIHRLGDSLICRAWHVSAGCRHEQTFGRLRPTGSAAPSWRSTRSSRISTSRRTTGRTFRASRRKPQATTAR